MSVQQMLIDRPSRITVLERQYFLESGREFGLRDAELQIRDIPGTQGVRKIISEKIAISKGKQVEQLQALEQLRAELN